MSSLGRGAPLVRYYQPFLDLPVREKRGMEVKHLRLEVMVRAAANYWEGDPDCLPARPSLKKPVRK